MLAHEVVDALTHEAGDQIGASFPGHRCRRASRRLRDRREGPLAHPRHAQLHGEDDPAVRQLRRPRRHRPTRGRPATAGRAHPALVQRESHPPFHRTPPRRHLRAPAPLGVRSRRARRPARVRGHPAPALQRPPPAALPEHRGLGHLGRPRHRRSLRHRRRPRNSGLPAEAIKADEARRIPLGRRGVPYDVARWIVALADPAADWITGQVIAVDGGFDLVA